MPGTGCRGFTVLELMFTVAIASVLLGLGVPAFNGLWLDSQRTVAVNALVHGLFLARTTAQIQGRMVSLCASRDGQSCAEVGADWRVGWMVFENLDRDSPAARDANEPVLAIQAPWPRGSIVSNRRTYSFRPNYHGVINGTVVFCDRRGSAQARAIIINGAGRPRVTTRDSDNRPLRCPSG